MRLKFSSHLFVFEKRAFVAVYLGPELYKKKKKETIQQKTNNVKTPNMCNKFLFDLFVKGQRLSNSCGRSSQIVNRYFETQREASGWSLKEEWHDGGKEEEHEERKRKEQ